jgi:hypothetical protein
MRTTIRLSDELLRETKLLAARSGKSLTAVIEEALREKLARQEPTERRKRVRLTTVGGEGVYPGVDLDSSAALLDYMDAHDADA